MTTISLSPVIPTTDDLQAAVLSTRAERDRLRAQRAELDRGAPHDLLERQQWYDARADLARLDRDVYRAESAVLQTEGALQAARDRHAAEVFAEARVERQALLRALAQQLDAAAIVAAELVQLDADVAAECDGHTFPVDHAWADALLGVDCRLDNWKRILRGEGWL